MPNCSYDEGTSSSQNDTESSDDDFIIPTKSITVDGDSSDWSTVNSYVSDYVNDDTGGLNGTDIEYFKLAQDTTNLYFLFIVFDGNINQSIQYFIRFLKGDFQIKIDYNATNWIVSRTNLGGTFVPYTPDYVSVNISVIEGKVLKSDVGDKNGKYLKIITKDNSNEYDQVTGKTISGL
jgi:hypothetical protein